MTAMLRLRLLCLLLLATSACRFGPRLDTFPPAQSPRGVAASLDLRHSENVDGELLEVREDAVVLLTTVDSKLVLVAFDVIMLGRFHDKTYIRAGTFVPRRDIDKLRPLSRFPQGIDDELMQLLLEHHGQPHLLTRPQ